MGAQADYAALVAARGTPAGSTIELLGPCNLSCEHCYVEHAKKSVMSVAQLDRIFGELRAMGAMTVTLTGGEIGLRKDLFEIVAAARARFMKVELLSTGTLWGPTEWDRLAELGVSYVRMSLYSDGACEHDAVTRSEGSFEKTMASARGLIERGIPIEFACPVTHRNAHKLGDVIDLGRKLGVKVHFDPNIFLDELGEAGPKETVARFDQLVAMYRDPRVLPLTAAATGCGAPEGSDRPCRVGEMSAFIRADGEVYPCVNWPASGGNITDASIESIWWGEVFEAARGVKNQDLSSCHRCGDRDVCRPCAGMNIREGGSLATPSRTICQSTEAVATALRGESLQARKHLKIV